jgi:para-aminobenzoate synthetase/4-amino-4-deoxychorismate lyase
MEASAQAFAIPFDRSAALRVLETAVSGAKDALRVRLTVNEAGQFGCTVASLGEGAKVWTYAISQHRVNSADLLLRHKTSWREMYEEEHAKLSRETGCDEVLFLNERGELTEGSRSNIFIRRDGKLFTPPQSAGLLSGCLRREMLADGECAECNLMPDDLENAEVFLGNSLRGLIRAQPARLA